MPFNPEITKTGRKNRKKKKQANTKTLGKSSSFDYLSTDKPLVENNMAKDFGTDILALDLVFFSVLQSCGGMVRDGFICSNGSLSHPHFLIVHVIFLTLVRKILYN